MAIHCHTCKRKTISRRCFSLGLSRRTKHLKLLVHTESLQTDINGKVNSFGQKRKNTHKFNTQHIYTSPLRITAHSDMISHIVPVTFTFLKNSLIYSQPLFIKNRSSPFHDRGQQVITCTITTSHFRLYIPEPRRWRNRFVRLPRERRLGVRIPEATDPIRKNRL